MRAVLKKASSGTRRVFRSIRCKKQASTVRKRYSVHKTGFCGTRRIFKGALNGILSHRTHLQRPAEQPTPQTVDSLLPNRTHFQRRAVPKAAPAHRTHFRGAPCQKQPPAAPDTSSVRETAPALFVRSGPFHHFLRPANAELVSGGPFPCSFDGTRYRKRPPTVPNMRAVLKKVLRQISCCQVKQVWKILIQRSRSEARPYILLLIYFILLFRPSISPLLIEYFMAFLMGEMSRWTLP